MNRWYVAIGLLVGVCCVILLPYVRDIIIICGNNVVPYPGSDLVMDYILGVVWALILWTTIPFWPVPNRDRQALSRLWLVKMFVALVVALAYEYRYALDPDGYFTNAIIPDFQWAGLHFGKDGTRNVHQLVWLHLHIVPNSYHAAKVGFSMIGLIALYVFYRAAILYLKKEDLRVLYALCLFPPILFWSSILGKDPITLLGMALYCHGVVSWYQRKSWLSVLTALTGCLVTMLIRFWYLPIMLGPVIVMNVGISRSPLRRIALILITLFGLTYSMRWIQQIFDIQTQNDLFDLKSYANTAFEGGGSTFVAPHVTNFGELIRFAPVSVFTALFRPLPLEVLNVFGVIEGLNNLALVILLILAIKRTRLRELFDPVIQWAVSLVLVWGLFYGLTASNFGSLVRYKLTILPILLGLLAYLSRKRTRVGNIRNEAGNIKPIVACPG